MLRHRSRRTARRRYAAVPRIDPDRIVAATRRRGRASGQSDSNPGPAETLGRLTLEPSVLPTSVTNAAHCRGAVRSPDALADTRSSDCAAIRGSAGERRAAAAGEAVRYTPGMTQRQLPREVASLSRPSWAPRGVDLDRPSAARVYDYYLGGFHNFPADREMAREAIQMWPELPKMMQANRAFLRRAVRFAAQQGVNQFLDIGSGIPTVGNSHEVAQRADAAARVVYVDIDPVAVAHSQAILGDDPATGVVRADLRDPERILADETVGRFIDFDRPVAILLVAVLHFLGDQDDPQAVIARLARAVVPGSYLVISHASQDGQPTLADSHQQLYSRTSTPMTMRTREQITALFNGFDLIEPGVVPIQRWRPESPSEAVETPRMVGFAGVGVKESRR